jgi:hypothetical protein
MNSKLLRALARRLRDADLNRSEARSPHGF